MAAQIFESQLFEFFIPNQVAVNIKITRNLETGKFDIINLQGGNGPWMALSPAEYAHLLEFLVGINQRLPHEDQP